MFNFEKGKGVIGVRHPDGKMIRSKRRKYSCYPEGYHELYDLLNDPDAEPVYKAVVDKMKGRLFGWLITAQRWNRSHQDD